MVFLRCVLLMFMSVRKPCQQRRVHCIACNAVSLDEPRKKKLRAA